ncbi:MAG TPA: flagellar biosynthesis protein FlhA [Kofleriaceae bacterium]|nr:flagellar biosynthesis protein FlhA [Kofleriaceae bacterium]
MTRRARSLAAAELAIAALVIAVVAMLIVPLPRPLLDLLLTLNIAISVVLLMAALGTPRPLSFAAFPALLVITTLFRVGLEVSVTRLILADADAGAVVRAFGGSVVAGSLVVGLVVFAVITVVQLVVVSRGAERVAEVAARFALDAMPGKQLAIDGELRAGAIDAEAARRRRTDLERESQLYGAMDGAMRFVKGDAIAAIVIVVINLIGGLVIGIGQRGLSADQAIRTYSLLSVGEGLVAQIPALVVAVASGLLVTRVASTGNRGIGESFADSLADVPGGSLGWLGGQPRVLGAAAVLLVALGLVPGLPLAPFVVLGAIAAGGAFLAARVRPRPAAPLDEAGAGSGRGPRLTLRLGPALHAELAARLADHHAQLARVRAEIGARAGTPLPPLAIELDPALSGEAALAIDATSVAWLPAESFADLVDKLPAALAPLAADLLTVDRVGALVERTAVHAPLLVREVVPRVAALPVLTEVLRSLAREQVPLDDLAAILDAIALAPTPAGGFTGKDAAALAEHLRGQLRRQISARWAPRGQLAVYTVDAMIEDAVRSSVDRRDGAAVLALEPAIAQDIVAAVKTKLGTGPGVILTSGDVRRHLRALLEPELPEVAILAAHELVPGTAVHTAGRIEV